MQASLARGTDQTVQLRKREQKTTARTMAMTTMTTDLEMLCLPTPPPPPPPSSCGEKNASTRGEINFSNSGWREVERKKEGKKRRQVRDGVATMEIASRAASRREKSSTSLLRLCVFHLPPLPSPLAAATRHPSKTTRRSSRSSREMPFLRSFAFCASVETLHSRRYPSRSRDRSHRRTKLRDTRVAIKILPESRSN